MTVSRYGPAQQSGDLSTGPPTQGELPVLLSGAISSTPSMVGDEWGEGEG
jgi:hypothetical protein